MSKMFYKISAFVVFFAASSAMSFDLPSYRSFLDQNSKLLETDLISKTKPQNAYFSKIGSQEKTSLYLDSIQKKYSLTDKELEMLSRNNFVVTERKSFNNFGTALRDIFNKDLPVFLSTDAVLYTMHLSYDAVLVNVERSIFEPAIIDLITGLRRAFPIVAARYTDPKLDTNLADIDLYLTIAASLISGSKTTSITAEASDVDRIWEAIQKEQYAEMPLFSTSSRQLDFSQFTARGHYIRENLHKYFKTMMWLGRTEFMLTAPKQGSQSLAVRKDLQRMTIDAALLSEVLKESAMGEKLASIDSLLSFLVGESDNLTAGEFAGILSACDIDKADKLLADTSFDKLSTTLARSKEASQKILSQVIMTSSANPDTLELPVSFLLLGQRFIVDSYIFGNVIYDKILYKNEKMLRLMPDPLDAMYALGNNDAAPLLKNELQQWHYAPQLENMRYLIDSYDQTFWHGSLYNVWLNTLRMLNPSAYPPVENQPLFMRSAAWHQEKLNTQLVSWAQLRHDNLLYAKQSYTPGTMCSYPHGYVEPYAAFYQEIALFSRTVAHRFSTVTGGDRVTSFYTRVGNLMDTLRSLANKELARAPFSTQDSLFMANMLIVDNMCGTPITVGWYGDLIFNQQLAKEEDYTIVDVHTQPTDEAGAIVGRVLHAGVGKINLGVFLAESPSLGFKPMAYVGPVASYYQKVSTDFKRFTDEEWMDVVKKNTVPLRPDWVNSYLIDSMGNLLPEGRALDGVQYVPTGILSGVKHSNANKNYSIVKNGSVLQLTLQKQSTLQINFYDIGGRALLKSINKVFTQGSHMVKLPVASGLYTVRIKCNGSQVTLPVAAIR